jgi:hypothetical protein
MEVKLITGGELIRLGDVTVGRVVEFEENDTTVHGIVIDNGESALEDFISDMVPDPSVMPDLIIGKNNKIKKGELRDYFVDFLLDRLQTKVLLFDIEEECLILVDKETKVQEYDGTVHIYR